MNRHQPKLLLIDRDGTIIHEPEDEQIDSFEKLHFLPGVITNLGKIARELDYELVMVTNQDGLGTAAHPEQNFRPVHNHILEVLKGEGVDFKEVLIDSSHAEENQPTRKPGTGLLTHYLNGDYDLPNSFVIGDRDTDTQLAHNLGCGSIYMGAQQSQTEPAKHLTNWQDIYQYLKSLPRKSVVERTTKETKIRIELCLEGSGKADISTGIGFFDHMLEQVAFHGGLDLSVSVEGDLHVDEHHTIEDTALALGEAVDQALGSRKGIGRYGFALPMDDSRAQAILDFGGRNWLIWEADFQREKIGQMPTEMFFHVFKSFSDASRSTIHVKAEGDNEHHKIEAIFKAFARALKQAVRREEDNTDVPSTKGIL